MAQQLADGMGRHVATFASPMDWSANGLGQGCTGHVLSRFPILESRTWSHHPPAAANPTDPDAPRSGVGGGLADGGVVFSRTAGAALLDVVSISFLSHIFWGFHIWTLLMYFGVELASDSGSFKERPRKQRF